MAKDPYKYFRLEARELLAQLNQAALEADKGGNDAGQGQKLLRLAHTLKGAARIVKRPEIAEHAHAIEDALGPYRDTAAIPRDVIDLVMKLCDEIGGQVQILSAPAAAPVATAEPEAADSAELGKPTRAQPPRAKARCA